MAADQSHAPVEQPSAPAPADGAASLKLSDSDLASVKLSAPDLEQVLREFETETAKPAPAKTEGAETTPAVDPVVAALDRAVASGAMTGELRNHLGQYGTMVQRLHAHQIQQQNVRDFENIVTIADKTLKDAGATVSADYARRWLTAEAAINSQLREAFDQRYESPAHQRRAEKLTEKALQAMVRGARAQPDPEATADRAAVATAVRGTPQRMPDPPPVRYGDLNDAEFRRELDKHVR